jgi:hypothetical protein
MTFNGKYVETLVNQILPSQLELLRGWWWGWCLLTGRVTAPAIVMLKEAQGWRSSREKTAWVWRPKGAGFQMWLPISQMAFWPHSALREAVSGRMTTFPLKIIYEVAVCKSLTKHILLSYNIIGRCHSMAQQIAIWIKHFRPERGKGCNILVKGSWTMANKNWRRKDKKCCRSQWFTPIVLATQEAEIRRIVVGSQPGQIVWKTLSWKKPIPKKGWWSGSRCRPWVQSPVLQKEKECCRRK